MLLIRNPSPSGRPTGCDRARFRVAAVPAAFGFISRSSSQNRRKRQRAFGPSALRPLDPSTPRPFGRENAIQGKSGWGRALLAPSHATFFAISLVSARPGWVLEKQSSMYWKIFSENLPGRGGIFTTSLARIAPARMPSINPLRIFSM